MLIIYLYNNLNLVNSNNNNMQLISSNNFNNFIIITKAIIDIKILIYIKTF